MLYVQHLLLEDPTSENKLALPDSQPQFVSDIAMLVCFVVGNIPVVQWTSKMAPAIVVGRLQLKVLSGTHHGHVA